MSGGCDNDNRPWCSACQTYHRGGDHEHLCATCGERHGLLPERCSDCSRVGSYTEHACPSACPRRVKLRVDVRPRAERLAEALAARDELNAKFHSYAGGDRAPSPPMRLIRECLAAEQRVREIEAET